jgi:hypothetical protein
LGFEESAHQATQWTRLLPCHLPPDMSDYGEISIPFSFRSFFFVVVNIDIGNAAGVHRSVIRNALLPSMI